MLNLKFRKKRRLDAERRGKNHAVRRFLLLPLVVTVCLFLHACGRTPPDVTVVPGASLLPDVPDDPPYLVVNVDSKTVHYDKDCSAVKRTKEENLRRASYDDETLDLLFRMGYHFCSLCQPDPFDE